MNELPQKTSSWKSYLWKRPTWTTTSTVALILFLTSVLLFFRINIYDLRAIPIAPTSPDLFPDTLAIVGIAMVGVKNLEEENRAVGIFILACMGIAFLAIVTMYLRF